MEQWSLIEIPLFCPGVLTGHPEKSTLVNCPFNKHVNCIEIDLLSKIIQKMVKSTDTELDLIEQNKENENKVEKEGKVSPNTSNEPANRQSEKTTPTNNDEEADHESGMRVGDEYQAMIPELTIPGPDEVTRPEPLQVWEPDAELDETKLDDYLQVAKDKYGYNVEQALGMLYWHKYNFEKSISDLQNFTPLPDEWSMEDKVIFEQSFNSHGKHFSKIRSQLPDKSISSLVKYYYAWKKTRNRTSLMDRQARRQHKDPTGIGMMFSDGESDGGEDDTSDSDFEPEKEGGNGRFSSMKVKAPTVPQLSNVGTNEAKPVQFTPVQTSATCNNCNLASSQLNNTPRGQLCNACNEYLSRTGVMRPKIAATLEGVNTNQLYKGPQAKLKKRPPKGMHLTGDLLNDISQVHGDSHVRPLEIELINLRRQVQASKQAIGQDKSATGEKMDKFRPPEPNQKLNARWTNEELLIAVQCVRSYGKDFQAMAEVLGNKTFNQCRNFFVNYRRRFNLLDILEEYEKENSIVSDRTGDLWDEIAMSDAESFAGMNNIPGPENPRMPFVSETNFNNVSYRLSSGSSCQADV
ncbi:REST corepressor 1-like isoform X2 [Rhopilema esculentum]|uniref:REST corepressor 1-like isoform X2 n=1 Tax=Rhopilema esculentum TaxID=499914 RepID=UPI0031D5CEF0